MEKNIINNNDNYIKNNNLFKKIDLAKYKSNIRENENNKVNNDFNQNQLSNYKNSFLDKKRIVFKSNLSEISKSPLDSSNNSRIKNNTKITQTFYPLKRYTMYRNFQHRIHKTNKLSRSNTRISLFFIFR